MSPIVNSLTSRIAALAGQHGKDQLALKIADEFHLTKDRSVYARSEFAIRFSSSQAESFSNTVLSLSTLQKYDDRPFIVCRVTPNSNICYLANSTFLKKISHSSHELRINNIRGSFNGSDIIRTFNNVSNQPENFAVLFDIHAGLGFAGNLPRLVESTNGITPSGKKFQPSAEHVMTILAAPERASNFVNTNAYVELQGELDEAVAKFQNEILLSALIENVNIRGRVIEYLIAGKDEILRQQLIESLHTRESELPGIRTDHALGDYQRTFADFVTETDVKTKILTLSSNPKAYNLDKVLEFLAVESSVFMFYFVGIEIGSPIKTALIPMLQSDLLKATIILRHWAGRNSRGVSQFDGRTVNQLLGTPSSTIDIQEARSFLTDLLDL